MENPQPNPKDFERPDVSRYLTSGRLRNVNDYLRLAESYAVSAEDAEDAVSMTHAAWRTAQAQAFATMALAAATRDA